MACGKSCCGANENTNPTTLGIGNITNAPKKTNVSEPAVAHESDDTVTSDCCGSATEQQGEADMQQATIDTSEIFSVAADVCCTESSRTASTFHADNNGFTNDCYNRTTQVADKHDTDTETPDITTSKCHRKIAFIQGCCEEATTYCFSPTPQGTAACCNTTESSRESSTKVPGSTRKITEPSRCNDKATPGCCEPQFEGGICDPVTTSCYKPETTLGISPVTASCCSRPFRELSEATDTGDCYPGNSPACCTDKKDISFKVQEIPSTRQEDSDLEKGNAEREHIMLSVSGMTCTGCETKLKRTLGKLNYISNLRTSLVLARVEFDIFPSSNTVEDVVKHLHRTTEFKCEQISNQNASLDLLVSPDDQGTFIQREWPDGVLDVRGVDKENIRVNFDARIIGARDLLNHNWNRGSKLAPPRPDPTLYAGNKHVRHMMWMTLLSAILTIPVLVMAWAPLPERDIEYDSASLALATLVQVIIAGPFYPKAVKALVFSRVIEMDLLIVLSTSAAYVFSVVSFGYLVAKKPLSTGEFFETSTLLVTLIMVGRWVASLARQKAAESISLRSLQTTTALLVGQDGSEVEIDARLLQYGDTFKIAPDSRIPTDGTVIYGHSEADESMLTGESQPVEKKKGSTVIAGSINGSGTLTILLTRLPGDNTISTIASMVDEAKLSKPRIQDIADKVASYFVPMVVAFTTVTFVVWVAIGIAVRKQSGSEAAIEAITYAITVLIVSCPCAIGLAVPMVIVVASGVAAKRGVVFKTATSIELAYKATDVVFDKTGTLTEGRLNVYICKESVSDNEYSKSMSSLLALLKNVKHPVSVAVVSFLEGQGITASSVVEDVKVVTGKGVMGNAGETTLRAGNSTWLNRIDRPEVKELLDQGLTTFCFEIDGNLVAAFGLRDMVRKEAASVVTQLQQRGISLHILSGDDDGAVREVASQLQIPSSNVRSRCTPAEKQTYIQTLLASDSAIPASRGSRKPVVLFVGDGTNDAVALAQATIGVHMASGTDIAQSAADVVLVRPNLEGILTIINVSKKAMRRVAFNFGWSFVYNLFAVLLGAGAFVHARIPPEFAGLGELVSVLPVILAAVLLRWSHI